MVYCHTIEAKGLSLLDIISKPTCQDKLGFLLKHKCMSVDEIRIWSKVAFENYHFNELLKVTSSSLENII